MTFAGEGCYFAEYGYGCQTNNPGFHRDTWAEQHVNASTDEQACLNRASAQWHYCGSHANHTVTSIYGPTGRLRERERERQRETERDRERQRDRETERQRQRQRQRDKERDRDRDREREREVERKMERERDGKKRTETERQTARQ